MSNGGDYSPDVYGKQALRRLDCWKREQGSNKSRALTRKARGSRVHDGPPMKRVNKNVCKTSYHLSTVKQLKKAIRLGNQNVHNELRPITEGIASLQVKVGKNKRR